MTYFETMLDELKFIAKRHTEAFERNCSEKVKKFIDGIRLEFVKYQPVVPRESDYEYFLFKGDGVNIELKHDLESLFAALRLTAPEYFNSFPSAGVKGTGFLVRIPNGWMDEYKDKEFDEELYEGDELFWINWKCPEYKLNERYKHFNKVMESWI